MSDDDIQHLKAMRAELRNEIRNQVNGIVADRITLQASSRTDREYFLQMANHMVVKTRDLERAYLSQDGLVDILINKLEKYRAG